MTKSFKITLSLNFRLSAVDCIKSGLTSLRLTLSLYSRLLAVDCKGKFNKSQVKPLNRWIAHNQFWLTLSLNYPKTSRNLNLPGGS